jgi:putative ABC transport system permease protein
MKGPRRFVRRLSASLLGRGNEQRLQEELEEHLALLTDEYLRAGLPRAKARRQAAIKLGIGHAITEAYRDQERLRWLEDFARHVRLGIRRLRHTPLFTLAVFGTLAVTIAANTVVFSAVNGLLLRPLPMVAPADVVVIAETAIGGRQGSKEVSYRDYLDWRQQSHAFEAMAIVSSTNISFVADVGQKVMRFQGSSVSASFFDVLGARAAIGRTFRAHEDVPGASRVIILGDALWRRQFGADSNVIGRRLVIGGETFQIVGVMPPDFSYPVGAEAWTPVVPALLPMTKRFKVDTLSARHFGLHTVLGRLRHGVSAEQARAELDLIVRRLPETTHSRGPAVIVNGLLDEIYGPTRRGVLLLFAMVGLVLLIACANVSSLVLARASALTGAFAVKAALGGHRWQLMIEWIIEIAMLTVAAGIAGVWLGWILLPLVLSLAPSSMPRLENIRVDPTVLVFAVGLCVLVTFLCAVLPALKISERVARVAIWRERTDRTPASVRGRGMLSAIQVAFAAVVLSAAGPLVRSVDQLRHWPLGFESAHVLTVNVEPQLPTLAEHRQAYEILLARIAALPGVEAVGATLVGPFTRGRFGLDSGYLLEGQRIEIPDSWKNNTNLNFVAVTPGYFETMRIPLLAGRFFSTADTERAQTVAVVSESTANRLWPNQSPIGKRISVASSVTATGEYPVQTVVGLVPDIPYRGLDERHFDIYVPATQTQHRVAYVVVRTAGDPLAIAGLVVGIVGDVARRSVVEQVRTLDALVSDAFAPIRFTMVLLVGLATLSVIVAAAGLYALTAYSVSQNARELAVRLALGGTEARIMSMVLWRVGRFALAGLVAGFLVSAILADRLSPLLFETPPRDLTTFLASGLLLGAITGLAAFSAARRITRIEPASAMRAL